ncbi:MAG: hypothetical protein ABEH38_08505 [Flavobacteriales bacterium]
MPMLKDRRFQKRLMLFLVGLLLGTLMVIGFFNDRFPSAPSSEKVRSSLKADSLLIGEKALARIDSLGIPRKAFKETLLSGEFILPSRRGGNTNTFHILTQGDPPLKVRLKVVDEQRTRVEHIKSRP